MRGSCWQVSRPGKLAARWEYRNNPVVDLEKVRAFASRHACTLPTLCPIQLRGPTMLAVPILWERSSGGLCVAGGCAAAAASWAVAAATFLAAQKVCRGP